MRGDYTLGKYGRLCAGLGLRPWMIDSIFCARLNGRSDNTEEDARNCMSGRSAGLLIAPHGDRRPSVIARAMFALLVTVMAAGCFHSGRKPRVTAPEFYGHVVRILDKDTIAVADAKVWTAPFSQDVSTDSSGYFSIGSGLVPGGYKVFAEFRGIKGQTETVPAELGKSIEVFIMLGEEATAWPPSSAFDKRFPKQTKGPIQIRRGS